MRIRLTPTGKKAVEETGITGWRRTDAVLQEGCPKCGAEKGHYCSGPSGRIVDPPHKERVSRHNGASTVVLEDNEEEAFRHFVSALPHLRLEEPQRPFPGGGA